jgi:hypothetical protein
MSSTGVASTTAAGVSTQMRPASVVGVFVEALPRSAVGKVLEQGLSEAEE